MGGMRERGWIAAAVIVAAALAGCARSYGREGFDGGRPDEDSGRADVAVRPDAGRRDAGELDAGRPEEPLRFGRCPGAFDPGTTVQCARVAVPLDWDAPGGGTIELYVERVPPASGAETTQLWMLNGGPGGASTLFTLYAPLLQARLPGVTIYSV